MDTQKQQETLERIKTMEDKSQGLDESLGTLARALTQVQNQLPAYQELNDYYYSENWEHDRAFSDSPAFTQDITCGVLSEDQIYNLLGDAHSAALQMLEIALTLLK